MKLTELEPKFLKRIDDTHHQEVDDIQGTDGIVLPCPVCFTNSLHQDKTIGVHSIICWQPHVPQTTMPVPGRWSFTGTGYDNLTLSPSVNLDIRNADGTEKYLNGCKAHFFIRNGEIVFA